MPGVIVALLMASVLPGSAPQAGQDTSLARPAAAREPAHNRPADGIAVSPTVARPIGPNGPQPTEEEQKLEWQLWQMINRERSNPANWEETRGRALPLEWDEALAQVARAHSQDMWFRRYFGHETPDGLTPMMRMSMAGVPWQSIAENIAECEHIEPVESAFMNEPRFEPNHRANILNPRFTGLGIGVVRGADGKLYVTEEFVERPKTGGTYAALASRQ